jgi:hypothetical protein
MANKKYVRIVNNEVVLSDNDYDLLVDECDREMEGHVMLASDWEVQKQNFQFATRVEVIDKDAGRVFVRSGMKIMYQVQDNGGTLKIFTNY